jgi:hypothetical protein
MIPRSGLRSGRGTARGAVGTDDLDRAGAGPLGRTRGDGSGFDAARTDDDDCVGIVNTPRHAVQRPCFPASFAASR